MEHPRGVVYQPGFEFSLAQLIPDPMEADRYFEGAEFTIARNPYIGREVESFVWQMVMAPVDDEEIVLLYTFDDLTVWFLYIGRPE